MNKNFYDKKYYTENYGLGDKEKSTRIKQELLARAFVLSQVTNPKMTLELGCGQGVIVEAFREHDIDAQGIDLSEWATKDKEYLIRGDITKVPFPKADLIYSFDVLEHLTDEEIEEVLKKCLIADNIFHSISVSLGEYGDVTWQPGMDKTHISMHTPEWWLGKMREIFKDYFITVFTRTDHIYYEDYKYTNCNFLMMKKQTAYIQTI